MARILALGFALVAGAQLAVAQSGSGDGLKSGYAGDTIVLQGRGGEYFIGGLPAGWRQIPAGEGDSAYGRGWVPEGQDPDNPRDSIIFQLVPQVPGMTPMRFFKDFAQSYRERCAGLLSTDFKPAENANGFDDLSVILACPHNEETSQGEVTLYRGIGGGSTFYLIRRRWRMSPFTAEEVPVSGKDLDTATKAVEFGYACQVGNQSRPCPSGWDGTLASMDKSSPAVVFSARN